MSTYDYRPLRQVFDTYSALRQAADAYADGDIDGDDLRSAVVDYTDSLLSRQVTYDSMGKVVRVTRLDREG